MTNHPRVSTILSLLYPGSLDFVEPHHLERGSRLHADMELWGTRQIDRNAESFDVYEECVPLIDWMITQGVNIVSCEKQLTHGGFGFTGRPDAVIDWGGKRWVVDYKFAETISDQNWMQMEAYHALTGYNVVVIQCNKEGKVKIRKRKPRPDLWAAFLSGLNVKKFRMARGEE